MKLDKVRFATLIGYICRTAGVTFSVSEIVEIDDIIDMPVPEPVQGRANAVDVDRIIELMAEGTQKIEAIKQYRMMTGMGLKESKDAVEKYWNNNAEAKLLARIRQALCTMADGDALVAVAKNAYRNGEELASQYNEEGSTLGDILEKAIKINKFEG